MLPSFLFQNKSFCGYAPPVNFSEEGSPYFDINNLAILVFQYKQILLIQTIHHLLALANCIIKLPRFCSSPILCFASLIFDPLEIGMLEKWPRLGL